MSAAREWKMPAWMEPYREFIVNTGGNAIEELVNDQGTTAQVNLIRAALIVAVTSQVQLLTALHKHEMLAAVKQTQTDDEKFDAAFYRGINVGRDVKFAADEFSRGNVISDSQRELLLKYDPDALEQ